MEQPSSNNSIVSVVGVIAIVVIVALVVMYVMRQSANAPTETGTPAPGGIPIQY